MCIYLKIDTWDPTVHSVLPLAFLTQWCVLKILPHQHILRSLFVPEAGWCSIVEWSRVCSISFPPHEFTVVFNLSPLEIIFQCTFLLQVSVHWKNYICPLATYVSEEGPGWGMFHPQLYDGDDFWIWLWEI